jgi:hypothetical protein
VSVARLPAVLSLLVAAAGVAAADLWLVDPRSGCAVADHYPEPGKSVLWNGPCREGRAEGPGTLEWFRFGKPEAVQTGGFVAGRAEGPGEVRWSGGRSYHGEFRHGLANGQGVFIWPNGRRYEGQWLDDHRTGFGTLTFPNGDRFVGRFERSRAVGEGEYITAKGLRLIGRVAEDGSIRAGQPIGRAEPVAPPPPQAGAARSRP